MRRRTGGGQRKADLSAKHEKAAAITVEKAQLCGIPPRNEVDSDAIFYSPRTFIEERFSFFKNLHLRLS